MCRANGDGELSVVDGALIVQPVIPEPPTLDELLSGITESNMLSEWRTGPAVGKEVW